MPAKALVLGEDARPAQSQRQAGRPDGVKGNTAAKRRNRAGEIVFKAGVGYDSEKFNGAGLAASLRYKHPPRAAEQRLAREEVDEAEGGGGGNESADCSARVPGREVGGDGKKDMRMKTARRKSPAPEGAGRRESASATAANAGQPKVLARQPAARRRAATPRRWPPSVCAGRW